MGDADLRRPLARRPSPTRSTAATWPRARPACRSPSTCRPRPATTPTPSWPAARSARSACRSSHIGDMRALFDGIPLDEMNTSMTINATAMWLLALYHGGRRRAGDGGRTAPRSRAARRHHAERHRQGVPLARDLRVPARAVAAADHRHDRLHGHRTCPKWNPINICSYHLQEAGATPVQEVAFALSTAIAVLDAVRDSGQVPEEDFGEVVGAHLVLRERRRALRRGDVQAARVLAALGRAHAGALRRHRRRRCAASATACRSTRWA